MRHQLVHLLAVGYEELQENICLLAVDDRACCVPRLVSERPDDRQNTSEMSVEILADLRRERAYMPVENLLELIGFVQDSALSRHRLVSLCVRRVQVDFLKKEQERILGCYAQHDGRGKDASGAKRLHCFLKIDECDPINGRYRRPDRRLVRTDVVEEIRMLVRDEPEAEFRNAKERELPVCVIQAQSYSPFAKKPPEHLKKEVLIVR